MTEDHAALRARGIEAGVAFIKAFDEAQAAHDAANAAVQDLPETKALVAATLKQREATDEFIALSQEMEAFPMLEQLEIARIIQAQAGKPPLRAEDQVQMLGAAERERYEAELGALAEAALGA